MGIIKFFLPLLIFNFLAGIDLWAQQSEVYAKSLQIDISTINIGDRQSMYLPGSFPLQKRIKKADFWISLDFGDQYISESLNEKPEISFGLYAKSSGLDVAGVFDDEAIQLIIDNQHPESFYVRDFTNYITSGADEDLSFDEIVIQIEDNNISGLSAGVIEKLRFRMHYKMEYGFDATGISVSLNSIETPEGSASREATFSWESNSPISHFQFQLLRLYNVDRGKLDSETSISANIDWNKANTILCKAARDDINPDLRQFSFSITEGTGFYVWRVRPVGDYYDGGVSNNQNWGNWSESPADGQQVSLLIDESTLPDMPYFFFTDPEEDKSWIFSKIYTEKSRVKELVSYSNSLNQVRQSITHLPSGNVSVITHYVLDHTGRPSLVTIPIPVEGKVLTYQDNLITESSSGQLYRAEHFDDETNFQDPLPVQNTGPITYYDNNDENVANADGYPFTRTIFYNDGSGRVKEASGVGLNHKIGSNHTTRHYYETATETELIALFGDEAPDSENVFKTITVDPNNVASITYTNKEGQTIATGLSFFEAPSGQLEDLDGESMSTLRVVNKVTDNSKIDQGFISSKRINVLQSTDLNIGYTILCTQLESLCVTTDFDCNYNVNFKIHRINPDNSIEMFHRIEGVELSDCQEISGKDPEASYRVATHIVPGVPAGTYIVQKELVPGQLDVTLSNNAEAVNNQIEPITFQITKWLDTVMTRTDLDRFFRSLESFAEAINNFQLETFTNGGSLDFPVTINEYFPTFFTEVYNKPVDESSGIYLKDYYHLSIGRDKNGDISMLILSTPCCSEVEIPVEWTPPFDCEEKDRNNDGSINAMDVPDFESFAQEVLSGCAGKDDLYNNFMIGWEEGQFNQMVYHMINDEYQIQLNGEIQPQYTCEELIDCWTAVLSSLKEQLCGEFVYDDGESKKVSDGFDDEYENDDSEDKYEKDHDTHFDDSFKGGFFLTRWIAKRKISKRMRDLQVDGDADITPEITDFHLVKEFLSCTDYKFAKILTPVDAAPLDSDRKSSYGYNSLTRNPLMKPMPFEINAISANEYFSGSNYMSPDQSYYYIPLNDWNPIDSKGNKLFPNIKNPIYAFKYFHYDNVGVYQDLEARTCFSDPNDCYKLDANGFYVINGAGLELVPCCAAEGESPGSSINCYYDPVYPATGQGKYIVNEFCGTGQIRCPSYYDSWSSSQRNSFFKMLENYSVRDMELVDIVDLNCSDYTGPEKWYQNINQRENGLPDLIPERILNNYDANTKKDFRSVYFDRLMEDGSYDRLDEFVMVEKEMQKSLKECRSGCENKRSEIRSKIFEMLEERCYVVGGCRTDDPSTFNVIPEEDIDDMVEAIIEACSNQCQLSTFSCESRSCRDILTPNVQLGQTLEAVKLDYGMGGHPNPAVIGYVDNDNSYYENVDFNNDGSTDARKYFLKDNPDINLSWYEYTILKQVSSWDMEITLPDKCDPDANTDCENPSANTFVPKENYEINSGRFPDEHDPVFNDPVYSPSIEINVTVDPANN